MKPLGRDQWSVKVERDENYVWIYYNNIILYLALLFTSSYTMMIRIYVIIYLDREKRLKSLVLLVLWVKWVVSPPLRYTLVLWVWRFPYHLILTPLVDLWSFIFYLVLEPFLCVVCDHMTYEPYSKCTQFYVLSW